MNRLKDKVAVITGSSSGIGESIARTFAKEGASVVLNYRHSATKAQQIVAEIKQAGLTAIALQADMADNNAIGRLIKETINEYGRIDIWVNNAGADILTGEGVNIDYAEKLQRLIEVDLVGTMNACRAIYPLMKTQGVGVIINMGWDLATHGLAGGNPQIFAATKAGVLGFTRSFAKSVGPDIRVNMVAPGWIATAFAENGMDEEYYQARVDEIPLGRFGKPEDVAATALFLASEESSYLTGEAIKINGGLI